MKMKRKCGIAWLLTVLCAVFLTVLTSHQEQDVAGSQSSQPYRESAVTVSHQDHHNEATLNDVTQLYRVCTSRSQRILPTHGSRTTRTLLPHFHFVRQHIVKPLYSLYDSRRRMESAPFCMSASSDYYVIALRHIIR